MSIELKKCQRCGYEWYPRTPQLPKKCPKCHNPYWNRVKTKQSGPKRSVGGTVVDGADQLCQQQLKHKTQMLALKNLKKRLQSPRLCSPGTIATYLPTAKTFMEWLPHNSPPTNADFREFFTWRRHNNISETTLRTEYFQIKKLAEANGWLWGFSKEDTPVSNVKSFQPTHSIADIEKMIAARDLLTKEERFYLAVATTWGCRREELSRIVKRDYNTETITIHIAKRGVDLKHIIPDPLKPVFEAYHPHNRTTAALSSLYHRICEKAGIEHTEGWGWNSIRRMVQTALDESLSANGMRESYVTYYMGWSQSAIGKAFGGSAMAGHYNHAEEVADDPWRLEKQIIAVHPFVNMWLKTNVKGEVVFS
jgi:integrase